MTLHYPRKLGGFLITMDCFPTRQIGNPDQSSPRLRGACHRGEDKETWHGREC